MREVVKSTRGLVLRNKGRKKFFKKRLIILSVSLLSCLCLMGVGAYAATTGFSFNVTNTTPVVDNIFERSGDDYLIKTEEDLAKLAYLTNNNIGGGYESASYKQTADITITENFMTTYNNLMTNGASEEILNTKFNLQTEDKIKKVADTDYINIEGKTSNYVPIGNEFYSFSGSYNGGGYKLSGIRVYEPETDYVGVFGYVENPEGINIKNLTVEDAILLGKDCVGFVAYSRDDLNLTNIKLTNTFYYAGLTNVGGLFGAKNGSLTNPGCTVGTRKYILTYMEDNGSGVYNQVWKRQLYTSEETILEPETLNSQKALIGFNKNSSLTAEYLFEDFSNEKITANTTIYVEWWEAGESYTNPSGFTFSVDSTTKTATLTGCTLTSATITIPGGYLYDGYLYPVRSINNSVFYNKTNLTTVTIPDTVRKIGYRYISSSATSGVFSNCTKLATCNISKYTNEIGDYAFYNTRITSFSTPYYLTHLSTSLFENNTSLASLTINKNIDYIARRAFKGCTALTSSNISINSDNIKYIGEFSFEKSHTINASGVYYLQTKTTNANRYVIKIEASESDATISLANSQYVLVAEEACTLYDGSDKIDEENITSLTIGPNIKYINANAFNRLTALETLNWNAKNCDLTGNIYSPFLGSINTNGLGAADDGFDVVFGSDVETIPDFLFRGYEEFTECVYIHTIDFSACTKLTQIGKYAFAYVEGTSNIAPVIPDTVVSIGDYAFSNINDMESFSFEGGVNNDSLETIGDYAFSTESGSFSSKHVYMPPSIKTIGSYAFAGWDLSVHTTSSTTVPAFYFPNLTEIGEGAFGDSYSTRAVVICEANIIRDESLDPPEYDTVYTKNGNALYTNNMLSIVLHENIAEHREGTCLDPRYIQKIRLVVCGGYYASNYIYVPLGDSYDESLLIESAKGYSGQLLNAYKTDLGWNTPHEEGYDETSAAFYILTQKSGNIYYYAGFSRTGYDYYKTLMS